jgi:hypothetical protein
MVSLSACEEASSSKPIPLPSDFTPIGLPVEWTPTPSEPTPVPGWKAFTGGGVELSLPANFEGGDPVARRDELLELIRSLGPEYESYVETVEQNPTGMILTVFDLESAGSIVGVTLRDVPSEMMLDEYLNGLLGAIVEQIPGTSVIDRSVVQRDEDRIGRVVLEFDTGEAISRQLTFVILDGGNVWTVSYASPYDRFEQMLPIFDLSILTFKYPD